MGQIRFDGPVIVERPEPGSEEVEGSLIGSILIDPPVLRDVSFITPDHFRSYRYRKMYEAILRLKDSRTEIDFVTVTDELARMGASEDVPAHFIIGAINLVPTSINAGQYAERLDYYLVSRRLITAASFIANLAYDNNLNSGSDLLWQAQKHLGNLKASGGSKGRMIGDIVSQMIDEALARTGEERHGIPSGFSALDKMFGGGISAAFHIIAARPSMGKSAFLKDLAINMARAGAKIMFGALEMSDAQNVGRALASEAGVSTADIRRMHAKHPGWNSFMEACGKVSGLSIAMYDGNDVSSPGRLSSAYADAERTMGGVDLMILDYLQLMSSDGRQQNREREVSEISRFFKVHSGDTGTIVMAAAQLSREVEKRQDKRPQLSDLRESGSLEQDADAVEFIYRDSYYNEGSDQGNIAEIIVAKNRIDGKTGTVRLLWDGPRVRFLPLHPDSFAAREKSKSMPPAPEHWTESY